MEKIKYRSDFESQNFEQNLHDSFANIRPGICFRGNYGNRRIWYIIYKNVFVMVIVCV